ncbi:MAG: DUF1990 domain-containing protein [Myxococcales bacterium]|nr:DUF1990 domain-containing protein [Myxococcales bacterium]
MERRRPDSADLRARLETWQRDAGFSYPEVGATRTLDGAIPVALTRRYDIDRHEFVIGRGEGCFERAREALLGWWHFRGVPWLRFVGGETPAHEGQVVASIVRVLGLWLVNPCRVVYLEPPGEESRRVRFAYGTLPGHVEAGEERFTVTFDEATGQVRYEIVAFSHPDPLIVRIGRPFARHMQCRFAAASAEALRRAVR